MAAALLICLTISLAEEVDSFLGEYNFQGYTCQWSRGLYLTIDEPCTLWVYTPESLQGVVCGAGGESVLNLHMELLTPDGNITDEYPDDLPVLLYSTGDNPGLLKVVVEVADMLYGVSAESVYVYTAMQPYEEIMIPAETDSTIQGE